MLNIPEKTSSSLWGPPKHVPDNMQFKDAPYAPFSKGDKLGKVADWASDPTKDAKDQKRAQHGRGFRDPYHAYGASSSSFFTNDENDASWSFSVVDSSAKAAPKQPKASNAVLKTRGRGVGQQGGRQNPNSGPGGGGSAPRPLNSRNSAVGGNPHQNSFRDGRYRRPGAWQNDKAKNRDPSVAILPTWHLIQSNKFSELQKLSYDVKPGETIAKYGFVRYFDKSLEKPGIVTRLKPVDNTVFNVSTSDDPVIQQLAAEHRAKVYATDVVIALLMCATKSNNPWEVIINKVNGEIFFDKRDGGPLDFLTVDENASYPHDRTENKAETQALSIEATYINQNFAANVVTDQVQNFDQPNPFVEKGSSEPVLAKGYLYKLFNLEADPESEPVNLVVRTEVDAVVPSDNGETAYVSVRALNEYGGDKPLEWKDRFANHRGAIVANEMKNNLNKLSQWTVQTLLSGAKALKIGFVSRANIKERTQHDIIGILNRDPTVFANNLGLNIANGWGIVKSIVNICNDLDDGKYVLLRDPNLPALKIYQVPKDTTFE